MPSAAYITPPVVLQIPQGSGGERNTGPAKGLPWDKKEERQNYTSDQITANP
jgi:hypothetical protein